MLLHHLLIMINTFCFLHWIINLTSFYLMIYNQVISLISLKPLFKFSPISVFVDLFGWLPRRRSQGCLRAAPRKEQRSSQPKQFKFTVQRNQDDLALIYSFALSNLFSYSPKLKKIVILVYYET